MDPSNITLETPPMPARAGLPPLAALLKKPVDWALRIREDGVPLATSARVLAAGLAFHVVYGFSAGLFGGIGVGLMAAMKAPVIAGASLGLCLPSLYVFCAVGDVPLSGRQAMALGASVVALTGLLLVGLAPVGWLFAVSTASLGFVTLLNLAIWSFSVLLGMRVLVRVLAGDAGNVGLFTLGWAILYVAVTLQMATVLRPILTPPPTGQVIAREKMFFLSNFQASVREPDSGVEGGGRQE